MSIADPAVVRDPVRGAGSPDARRPTTTSWLRRFAARGDAATVIEYALLLALIAVVVLVAVQTLGNSTNTLMTNSANAIGS